MRLRSAAIAIAVVVVVFTSLGLVQQAPGVRPVSAAPGQSWPAPREAMNLEIIGHNDLGQIINNTAEVWYGKGIAYVSYRCSHQRNPLAKGTSIVDVHDPTKPVVLAATEPFSGGFADDVWGLNDLNTDSYKGDLLVEPHDFCSRSVPQVTRFWNVTNPAKPVLLSSLVTGDGVHNVYAFTRMENGKQKAYVILAAPFADTADNTQYGWEDKDLDADFAIVDATDPTKPEIISKFNLHQAVSVLPAGSIFQHDTWANKAGTMAYGAYWDAGVVFLDISDIRNIKYVNHWFYSDKQEGNTHGVVLSKNEDYAVVTDEDFDPTESDFMVLEPPAIAGKKRSTSGAFGGPGKEGEIVWTGRGCPISAASNVSETDKAENDTTGKIALIKRGSCTFAEKVQWAQDHGAVGAVIMNNAPGGSPASMGGAPMTMTNITGAGISYEDGMAISATLAAGMPVRVRYGQMGGEWGYTRIVDIKDVKAPKQVAEYVVKETRQYPEPTYQNLGYSVHNAYVQGDKVYIAHYDAGIRVLDIANPAKPVEEAYLVPAAVTNSEGRMVPSSMWGVIADEKQNIYGSDLAQGLWVMREPRAAVPTPMPPTATPRPVIPTTAPPTAIPPTEVPQNGRVCPQLAGHVPQQVISAALANPAGVSGYMLPERPSLPIGPSNPPRTWLTLLTYAKPYHPSFNTVVYRASCP